MHLLSQCLQYTLSELPVSETTQSLHSLCGCYICRTHSLHSWTFICFDQHAAVSPVSPTITIYSLLLCAWRFFRFHIKANITENLSVCTCSVLLVKWLSVLFIANASIFLFIPEQQSHCMHTYYTYIRTLHTYIGTHIFIICPWHLLYFLEFILKSGNGKTLWKDLDTEKNVWYGKIASETGMMHKLVLSGFRR